MNFLTRSLVAALLCALMVGCPAIPPGDTGSDGTDGSDAGVGSAGDVSETALNFGGNLSGSLTQTSSTGSTEDTAVAQTAPISSAAVAYLTDLQGNRLLDANGNEYPEFPIDPDGSFELGNLPVGVDIVIVIDLDGDGQPDLFTIVNIPKDADGESGTLNGVDVDPLSTLANAKLRQMLEDGDVDPGELDLSLSGIIGRTRDAYEHLFEDAGIDHAVLLNDIRGLISDELAEFFDTEIPVAAQRGMRMAVSNIALAGASDLEDIVKAAAQTLLEGGFVIADDPGGVDLSFLGDLPHVNTLTFEQFDELFAMQGPGEPPPARGVPDDFEQASYAPPGEPLLYISELAEADRNFAMAEEGEQPFMPKPMFGELMLTDIAEFYMDGRTISLGDLYQLLVDAEIGLGVRLAYNLCGGPGQPPTEVFESPDGGGIEKDMSALFQELDALVGDPGFDPMATRTASVRQIIVDFLTGTAEPSFERLFGGFLMDRVPSAEEFAQHIRQQRAHIPFSRSGPAQWFVVADADSWQNPDAAAVTVDIETDSSGGVTKVTLNPGGDGRFFLGHGPLTETGMRTELIRRSNGRMLHDHNGEPQFLEMSDGEIFQPVNGESFFDAFSETGSHWPGAPALRVPNHGFDPTLPPDPETNPPDWEAFVLMTGHGPDAVPVRVNYAGGVATYAESGTYYMLFDADTDANGLFALMSETGELLEDPPGAGWENRVLVDAEAVQGVDLAPEVFTCIYGIEVPNEGYDPEGAPYYDDINNNGQYDTGEPTFAEQHFLGDPADWRSTWVERYYRRADNNGFPTPEQIDWQSETPALFNGVVLIPRNFQPRLNGFLYGRPNSALNLLLAFSPPEFFNGTQTLDENTRINPLMAIALIDLVFEQTMNVEAMVDWDGPGGMSPHEQLVPAWFFIAPVDDPISLVAENFETFAE